MTGEVLKGLKKCTFKNEQEIMNTYMLHNKQPITPTASLQRGKTPPISVLIMTIKILWWGSSNSGVLGNVENPFIVIAPRSILAQSSSTW